MNTPTVDDRLSRIGPTGSPDPDALAAAYAQLTGRLELPDTVDVPRNLVPQPQGPRTAAVRQLGRRRARRISLTVLVGAAAAFAVVAIPVLSTGGRTPISTASAAEVLLRAGEAAGEQPGDSRDAAYWHTSYVYTDVQAGVESARVETWAGHQEWSVMVNTAEGSSEPFLSGHAIFGPRITWDELFALPTDPAALESALRRYLQPDDPDSINDAAIWGAVFDLLAASPATPALRQALFEVAAQLSDTTAGGDVTDSTGRPGVLVIHNSERLIVDPETGLLLERVWDYGTDIPPYRATYLEQGPTDTAPYAPYPDLPAGCTLDAPCDGGHAVEPTGGN